MPSVKLVVTDAGIAEVINAEADGTAPVKLTEIGLGTGKYTATGGQEALVSEFKRLDTVAGGAVGTNIIHVTVTDDSDASYAVYEIGLYTESGTLFAVYSQSLPIIQKASAALMMLSLDIALTNLSNTSVTFGDTDFTMAPATTDNQGIAELATHEEVQAGTDDTRIVTPAGLKSAMDGRTASDSQTGLVELATAAEVQAGTDGGKAVTPAGLSSRTATEGRTGLAEIATQTEVDAGTDDSRIVTPKKLKAAMDGWDFYQQIEAFRKSMIGALFPFARATLPGYYAKPDGSLILFEDYPEFAEAYEDGAFDGMLLEATATDEEKQTWAGKWVKNSQGTGLYAPRLQGLFLRNGGTMGAYNAPGLPDITGRVHLGSMRLDGTNMIVIGPVDASGCFGQSGSLDGYPASPLTSETSHFYRYVSFAASKSSQEYGAQSTIMPASVDMKMGIYLGKTSQV